MLTDAETRSSYARMVDETATDFRVRTCIYTDPEIFQEEMHRIFEGTAYPDAFPSELGGLVPAPGAYPRK